MALIDVIQHPSERSDEIVFRVPQQGAGEFKFGSQLIVREGQAAVFFRDGKALDTFGPGRHTLNTNNLPLLTGIMGIAFGGATPFTAEVYFVSLREFSDLRWGTAQPVVFRDTDFGMVRLRAFGGYSMRVGDPQLFVQQVVGSQRRVHHRSHRGLSARGDRQRVQRHAGSRPHHAPGSAGTELRAGRGHAQRPGGRFPANRARYHQFPDHRDYAAG